MSRHVTYGIATCQQGNATCHHLVTSYGQSGTGTCHYLTSRHRFRFFAASPPVSGSFFGVLVSAASEYTARSTSPAVNPTLAALALTFRQGAHA